MISSDSENKPKQQDTTIFNTHTHIFTIDHVPNLFSRKLIPFFYRLFTIKFIKWYYNSLTKRGSKTYKKFIHRLEKIKYAILNFFKKTYVLHWIYASIRFVFNWVFNIVTHFVRVDFIFSKRTRAAIDRYLTMGRYSVGYKTQSKIFGLLKKSYAPNTKFVVLSMDMDYMEAGVAQEPYLQQLNGLLSVKKLHKNDLFPFVAVDPRRIEASKKQDDTFDFEKYVQKNIIKKNFSGIKLYPALGYYPFDKNLIDTYVFAQKNDIPITTHCIEGSVFYRGKKRKEWNVHPILTYNKKGTDNPLPIPLPKPKNEDFTTDFTHPLNYHCLLNQELLSRYIPNAPDLKNLKICIAHFGGASQWKKYQKDNWNTYNNNISHATAEEYKTYKNTLRHRSTRTIWWSASWLSVIYDLMVTYPNVYADISFILHDESLFPLLKFLIEDPKIGHKVLFGTDYYVVSQNKNEKVLYHSLKSYLGEDLFYKISNTNAKRFLSSNFEQFD